MKRNALNTAIVAGIFASVVATHAGGASQMLKPEARGKSVLSLSTTPSGEAELLIYGPIGDYYWGEGVTALNVVDQLAGTTAATINVRINSDGGVVQDGLAIYNALKRHGATINVFIDGMAASIASLIAMAGKTISMPSNTLMMLHAPMASAFGNAALLREAADVLDTFSRSMTASYAGKAKKPAELTTMLTDGKDHWFTAAEAVAFGLADVVIEDEPKANVDAVAAAALLSYITAITASEGAVSATLRAHLQTTTTPSAFASLSEGTQRAVYAQLEETSMLKQQCYNILAQVIAGASGTAPAAPAVVAPPQAPATPVAAAPAGQPVPVPAPAPVVDVTGESVFAALATRNEAIRGVFAGFTDISGIRELETSCLADPRMTVEQAQGKLLARIGNGATPLAASGGGSHVQPGDDQADKLRSAGVQILLARAGMLSGAEDAAARQGNPFLNCSLIEMAERSLIRAQVNTRSMSRDEIARRVLAVQTTSDFPLLLENALHKMVLTGYRLTPFTWNRFAAIGTLADYRPHNRYHLSSFSDLKAVNEAGEYENGVLGDGAKETIKGARKGRILQITPEVLVNDDVGAFARIAVVLGQAAGRTIEKDVYALFALNSGNGPTMSDGNPLFHASHNNIAAVAAVPSVDSWDAARLQLGNQLDVGGNDYLDITPAIWLGPNSIGTKARLINVSEYNPDVTSKFQVPNTSRGMVRDVIDTPRLSGTAWFMLADQNIEPVFEVAFLNGVQTPTIEQETNFRTDGLSWKVVHKYGVGAVGWRGAVKNAGV
jgi:ATP-dependent protease ClpP protease subunit